MSGSRLHQSTFLNKPLNPKVPRYYRPSKALAHHNDRIPQQLWKLAYKTTPGNLPLGPSPWSNYRCPDLWLYSAHHYFIQLSDEIVVIWEIKLVLKILQRVASIIVYLGVCPHILWGWGEGDIHIYEGGVKETLMK